MNISPETKKVSEIFSITSSHIYEIPIYQRNYSWGTTQIETLIDDINNESKNYYIGNLLVNHKNDDVSEIVDGQQRLTTIALILIAIYETASVLGDSFKDKIHQGEILENIGSLKKDIKRQLLVNGIQGRPKYIMLESDNEIFLDLLKITSNENTKRWKNRIFGKRYEYTFGKIQSAFQNFSELNKFYEKLNNVEILKIKVTNLSDAFSVFSALNSKGLPLTLIDLLKNEYLRIATDDNLDTTTALQNWEKLIDIFADDQEIDINFATKFLLNNFDAFESTSSASLTKSKALNKYNEILRKNSSKYIFKLVERGRWYLFINNGPVDLIQDERMKDIINELSYLDISQSLPLLMFIFSKRESLDLSNEQLIEVLKMVRNFYVIRNITQRPKASNIRSMFININRKIQNDNIRSNEIPRLVKDKLTSMSDKLSEFKDKLINDGIYDKNPSTTRYLLITIERSHEGFFNKANPDNLEETIDKYGRKYRWTIEHILPQGKNLPEHWINMIGSRDNYKNIQEIYVHRLGNLTLTPYNAELGQKPFEFKRDKQINGFYVGLQMNLYLNKSIEGPSESISSKKVWDTTDIDRRGKALCNEIIEILDLNNFLS